MTYDEGLAARAAEVLADTPGLVEKRMFGGIGYLVDGNMACGVHGDGLIVRVGPDAYESNLSEPYTREFDLTGHPMRGWIVVEPAGYADEASLADWVSRGVAFARTLPAK